jgi:uncharacterized protein (TIGR02453 family)
MGQFNGFSKRALSFYEGLEHDNTKDYWTAHKSVYESEVAEPLHALLDALEDEFGPGKLFRPYRDVRFSRDKSPYKTYQAAFVGTDLGVGYYVQVDADGLLAGGGFRAHSTAQVERYRRAVDAGPPGEQITGIVDALKRTGFEIRGDQVKSRPRGYPADHPRIELLRYKELMASKPLGAKRWLATSKALDQVRDTWRSIRPLSDWVGQHVGPA